MDIQKNPRVEKLMDDYLDRLEKAPPSAVVLLIEQLAYEAFEAGYQTRIDDEV